MKTSVRRGGSGRRAGKGGRGQVRIVAGLARGRRLAVPRGLAVRPTPDRVREALFSILGDRCEGARVLDACAGTGALGLEALSRGAARVLLVERDRLVAETLRRNVEACGLPGATLLVGDVVRLVPRLAEAVQGPFDLVFVDPPFGEDLAGCISAALLGGAVLAPGVLVVVEHPPGSVPSLAGLRVVDQRRYGSVALTFCESET